MDLKKEVEFFDELSALLARYDAGIYGREGGDVGLFMGGEIIADFGLDEVDYLDIKEYSDLRR